MKCHEVMKRNLASIALGDTVRDAALEMQRSEVDFLAVSAPDGTPVGGITDRELMIKAMAEGWPSDTPIAKVMSFEMVCCDANQSLSQAAELMRQERVSRVLCVDDSGCLAGVVSLAEVSKHERVPEAVLRIKAF